MLLQETANHIVSLLESTICITIDPATPYNRDNVNSSKGINADPKEVY